MADPQEKQVSDMVAALPDRASNPTGHDARRAFVTYVESLTTGDFPFPRAFSTDYKPLFPILYGNQWQAGPHMPEVPAVTGEKDVWNGLCLAATAHAIHSTQANSWDRVNIDAVRTDLASLNNTLRAGCALKFYSYMLQQSFAPFATIYAQAGDKPKVKQRYIETLKSAAWQQDVLGKLANPMGTNPNDPVVRDFAWYLFHHWVKLHALGATIAEVNAVIESLPDSIMSKDIASVVGKDAWVGYMIWLTRPGTGDWMIDGTDIVNDAAGGLRYYNRVWRPNVATSFSDPSDTYASQVFITGSGSKYYREAAGSCFVAGTKVVLPDGALTNIEDVRPGDQVAGPGGQRRVIFVAQPYRAGRMLHDVNHGAFRFASTHPFYDASHADEDTPSFVAIEPHRLGWLLPTLSDMGIGQMRPGSRLLAYRNDGDDRTVLIDTITSHDAAAQDDEEVLYDVVLEPDDSGLFQYYAGDTSVQYLVASEVPLADREPLTAIALIRAVLIVMPVLRAKAGHLSRGAFETLCRDVVSMSSSMPELVHGARELLEVPPTGWEEVRPDTLPDAIGAAMNAFILPGAHTSEAHYDWRLGRFFELLMLHAARPLSAAIEQDWRHLPISVDADATVLAVTPHHLAVSAVPDGECVLVECTLLSEGRSDTHSLRGSNERSGTKFAHHFPDILYFDVLKTRSDASRQVPVLALALPLPDGSATARVPLPYLEDQAHRHMSVPLLTLQGNTAGMISLDIRVITKAHADEEQAGPPDSGAGGRDPVSLANAIGTVWGERMAARFALEESPAPR